ncbi:MAG: dynamin family protein [Marinospirillum sp.]|uniref:dynamin family protein n=1 Tax=Marinospirillum sp. TaxID=2183934 RepID=UPI0019F27E1B|nr:dynamin family protein [Marinospirillum sp.]MBE0507806.1 dynamin family protein [Marinospirillum sp.]
MNELTQDELWARYLLVCRASHADSDTSPVQNELADELSKLKKIITHELPELARQRSPHNFTELHQNLMLEMERFHEFCEFPHLAEKVVVGLGGAFSAGKSSLINALLGQKRLATEVDPTTSLPTYLLQGEAEAITALNLFKRRVELSQEEFLSLTHDEKERYGSQVSALLQSAFISLPDFPFKNLALLDTPGYSKPDDKSWSDRTDANLARAQLNSAQFIIWVVSAEAGVISENDLKFLASLRQDIPRLVVISRADKRTPEDMQKMVELVRTTMEQRALPAVAVLPFSSRKKKDYPVKPIIKHLQRWSAEPRALPFKVNFMSQLALFEGFLTTEKKQAQRRLARLNRILTLVDDHAALDDLTELKAIAGAEVKKVELLRNNLQIIESNFITLLESIGHSLHMDFSDKKTAQKSILDALVEHRKHLKKSEPNYSADFATLKKAAISAKKESDWGIQFITIKNLAEAERIFIAATISESIKANGYINQKQFSQLEKMIEHFGLKESASELLSASFLTGYKVDSKLINCFENEDVFAEFAVNLIFLLSLNEGFKEEHSVIFSEINKIFCQK